MAFPARLRTRPLPAILILACALAVPAAAPAAGATLDPMLGDQWALHAADGGLDAETAWRATDGAGAIVAILDTGVDQTHPDLKDALWTNPNEIPGNGVDDDHDGYVDDIHGADLMNGDGDPADDEGHGTHVAGIIAAQMNAVGVRGLAPGARIMAVKVLDSHRAGSSRGVADGIQYALAHGATVINTSINGDSQDPVLEDAVRAAQSAGVIIAASAGNDGRDLDLRPSYPASYPESNVIAVSASDRGDLLASFSNFGRRGVDLAAPGTDVLSTSNGGGYELRSGTSMAAPYVAATVALLHAVRPDLDADALRGAILAGVKRSQGLLSVLAAGELDPVGALLQVVGPDALKSSTNASDVRLRGKVKRRVKKTGKTLLTWTVTGDASGISRYRISGPGGKTLARRPGAARGAWVRQRKGRVRITAIGADGKALGAITLRLG